jgi:tetratricopeptide (TPR) repeat protein
MGKTFQQLRRFARRPRKQLERTVRAVASVAHDPPRDVWHWTTPKYRLRAVILLLVNASLFAGLACFTFWLRTGQYTPFNEGGYWGRWWETFDPTGQRQVTLIDFLLHPISAEQVPMMMIIVPLMLASLTAIPILVSMLYRFPFSLIFTAIIMFVAVYPWLAITVTLCCYLARLRPLQFSFRFATALISLLPLVSYYALATRGAAASPHLGPLEMARLYLPWVTALLGGCMVMAIVLTLARVVNYRPGAMAPLMAIMFAMPVVLFEAKVGRDELYYRLLEADFGPKSSTHFVDHVRAADLISRTAARRADELGGGPAATDAIAEQLLASLQARESAGQPLPDDVGHLVQEDLATQQYEAAAACRQFRESFPRSRYIPNALYIEAQTADARIASEYGLFRGEIVLRYYQDFPSPASQEAWRELHEKYPESPLSAVACLRLALLAGRAGRTEEGLRLLTELIARAGEANDSNGSATTQAVGFGGVLARAPASSTIDLDMDSLVLDARQLKNLMAQNRDPQQDDLALRMLLGIDPHHPMYRQNLERLYAEIPTRFPATRLAEDLRVLIARAQPSRSVRIEQLRTCIDQLSGSKDVDALARARFELGVAYEEDNRPEEARAVFEEVKTRHPDSPWAFMAVRRLASRGAAVRTAG